MAYPVEKRIGYKGVTEQQAKFKWDPRTGWQTTRTFKGPGRLIVNLFPQLQQGGYSFDCSPVSGVNYVLVATIGNSYSGGVIQDNPVDLWELTSTKAEKDLLQADIPIINNLTTFEKQIIRDNFQSPPSDPTKTANVPPGNPQVPADLTGNALTVYNLMVEGFTGLPINAPVLRRTQTVSNVNAVQAAVNGSNTLFNLSSIGPPPTLNIDFSSLGTAGKTGYAYGWYKDFPNARASAFNKTQITTEWAYGLWPIQVFGNPV